MIRIEDGWSDAEAWDAFVRAHPQSRYCQLFGYGRVVASYGYKPRYLAFLRNQELVGVLPAAEVSSVLYRRRLVSQPFSEYGGLLLHPGLSDDEVQTAFDALRGHLGGQSRASSLELHGNHGAHLAPDSPSVRTEAVGYIAYMELTSDTDTLWRDVVRYSVRKAVKQAQNYGVTISFACDQTILEREFFPLYLKSMKRLGVPPHKFAYYGLSLREFGSDMMLAMARAADGSPIAGLLGFTCGSRVNIINTVSDPEYWNLKANDLLHWEAIKRTAEAGHRFFDFGSVRYEGQSTYKKKWGTVLADHHNYLLASTKQHGERQVVINSSSDSMKRMSRLWSAYMPDRIGQHIGPLIRGQLAR
ncbi:MAG: GNAT family N-acetyltransferase [Alphaproteobacteria bacterium]|nr:GNAT family N-acetyltransferase [Alphaproteobacteria bacterium]